MDNTTAIHAYKARKHALTGIYNAQSGHPGGSLSIADILAVLYFEEMNVDPENPKIMEDFISALGAEPVIYAQRNECCGGYISLKEKALSGRLCSRIAGSAADFGAECLVTACPLCKYNLSRESSLPVVYFTELLAEALGIMEVDA